MRCASLAIVSIDKSALLASFIISGETVLALVVVSSWGVFLLVVVGLLPLVVPEASAGLLVNRLTMAG